MPFDFHLRYRTQSEGRGAAKPGRLKGRWRDEFVEFTDRANGLVRRLRPNTPPIDIRVADVSARTGPFANSADALYYKAYSERPTLPCDIIDATKLQDHWRRRRDLVALRGFRDFIDTVETNEITVAAIAAKEYILHEVGHRIGFGLFDKQASGYFRLSGSLSWPLIFFEEHRADMMSFSAASRVIAARHLGPIAAYHVVHRMGLALESAEPDRPGAGLVPFLLLTVLVDAGALNASSTGLTLNATPSELALILAERGEAIAREDTRYGEDLVDAAIRHGEYVNRLVSNDYLVNAYDAMF